MLVRHEAEVALGSATGDAVAAKVIEIATGSNRDVAAVLLNSRFGETLLQARGLTGRDYARTLAQARKIAAVRAVDTGLDAGEVAASIALKKLGKLGAARGSAGIVLKHSLDSVRAVKTR
jgi:hypothetical protein